jgi:hypothetical protein
MRLEKIERKHCNQVMWIVDTTQGYVEALQFELTNEIMMEEGSSICTTFILAANQEVSAGTTEELFG